MYALRVESFKDLPQLLESLNTEDDTVSSRVLEVWMKSEAGFLASDDKSLFWDVLSHPNSKIDLIELLDASPDVLVKSNVLMHVKRWCQEIPAFCPRQLRLNLTGAYTEKGQEFGNLLRGALTHPNNRVEELCITNAIPLLTCSSFLRPILENPNNELLLLEVCSSSSMELGEANSLSLGLASPNCKLEIFKVDWHMGLDAASSVLDGVYKSPRLEQLEWWLNNEVSDTQHIVIRLSQLLERPGNHIMSMTVHLRGMERSHSSVLAKGLVSEACQLQRLAIFGYGGDINATLPIVLALRHPRNQLRALTVPCHGLETADALGGSLKDPNCKLRSLTVSGDETSSFALIQAIPEALQFPNVLEKLDLCYHREDDLAFFVESLGSRNNRLTVLTLRRTPRNYSAVAPRNLLFFRALRTSNVQRLFTDHFSDPFYRAFNAKFFQVLHTLLSIKYVPRLARSASLKVMPFQDFIFKIAKTLGWPLDDLRLPDV